MSETMEQRSLRWAGRGQTAQLLMAWAKKLGWGLQKVGGGGYSVTVMSGQMDSKHLPLG